MGLLVSCVYIILITRLLVDQLNEKWWSENQSVKRYFVLTFTVSNPYILLWEFDCKWEDRFFPRREDLSLLEVTGKMGLRYGLIVLFFTCTLWFNITHTETHTHTKMQHTGANRLTQPYKYILTTPVLCCCVVCMEWTICWHLKFILQSFT